MRLKLFITFLALVFLANFSFAAKQQRACAKYLNTNRAYLVDVTIISGNELNRKTGSYSYGPLDTYAVIFWADGQASVIELDYFFGSLNIFGNRGYDQQGRPWNISTNTTFCF